MERPDDGHLADRAAAHEIGRLADECRRAALEPDLDYPAEAPRRADHRAPLAHHERQRLLHVHVLARRAVLDHLERMPMVGRGHDHGVDVAQLEQPPVVLELAW